MSGCVSCRGLCRECALCCLQPPVYSPTSPYECVGLGLREGSHSPQPIRELTAEKARVIRHMPSVTLEEDNGLVSGDEEQREPHRAVCGSGKVVTI